MSQTTHVAEAAPTQESKASDSMEILEQLMKPEVQQSLTVLIEHLPKLTEMAVTMSKFYDVAKSVATDPVLIDDFKHGIEEFVGPIQSKAKEYVAAAIEANERAEAGAGTTIGVFGLLKMLKDPQIQRAFRFTQAYLDVIAQQKK